MDCASENKPFSLQIPETDFKSLQSQVAGLEDAFVTMERLASQDDETRDPDLGCHTSGGITSSHGGQPSGLEFSMEAEASPGHGQLSVGDVEESGQVAPSQQYHYDYTVKRWFCDIPNCSKTYGKKIELEVHRWRVHQLMEPLQGAKRGRIPKDPANVRVRDWGPVQMKRLGDPEWHFEQQIRQGKRRWAQAAKKVAQILIGGRQDLTQCDASEFVDKYVQQREAAYRANKEERIRKIAQGIKERYGHFDSDEDEGEGGDYSIGALVEYEEPLAISQNSADTICPPCSNALRLDLTLVVSPGSGGLPLCSTMVHLRPNLRLDLKIFALAHERFQCSLKERAHTSRARNTSLVLPYHLHSSWWGQDFTIDAETLAMVEQDCGNSEKASLSWISTDVVGAYFTILCHVIPLSLRPGCLFLNPCLLGLQLRGDDMSLATLVAKLPLPPTHRPNGISDIKVYFLPACNDFHWSLWILVNDPQICAAIGVEQPALLYLDSLDGFHRDLEPYIRQIFLKLWNKWGFHDNNLANASLIKCDLPSQGSASDCGVWTCLYGRYFIEGFVLQPTNTPPTAFTRDWIMNICATEERKSFRYLLSVVFDCFTYRPFEKNAQGVIAAAKRGKTFPARGRKAPSRGRGI